MKRVLKILIFVLIIVLFWFGVKVTGSTLDKHFVKSPGMYYTPLENTADNDEWISSIESDSQTECLCLNLLTILKNGDIDEFEQSFIYNYDNSFNDESCFLIIRRVFVNNSDLSWKETEVLLRVLDMILEQDKDEKNTTAVYRNYMLQQEILYRSGRIIQAYKLDDVIQNHQ